MYRANYHLAYMYVLAHIFSVFEPERNFVLSKLEYLGLKVKS